MADEKFDEKEMEKREEKSPEEKSWDEKWSSDPLNAVMWAAIFIWAGLVFLASNLGWLDQIALRQEQIPGLGMFSDVVNAWPLVLVGAGVIVLITAAIRLLVPAYRRPVLGYVIFGLILLGIGLGDLVSWNIFFPMILIIIGIVVIFRGFRRAE